MTPGVFGAYAVELGPDCPVWATGPEDTDRKDVAADRLQLGLCAICGDVALDAITCGRRECARRFDGWPTRWRQQLTALFHALELAREVGAMPLVLRQQSDAAAFVRRLLGGWDGGSGL